MIECAKRTDIESAAMALTGAANALDRAGFNPLASAAMQIKNIVDDAVKLIEEDCND